MIEPDDASAWARGLWHALPADRRPREPGSLETAVADAWQRARSSHPAIAIAPLDWFGYVGTRLRVGEPSDELGRRSVADLYLACGCARGLAAALQGLEDDVIPVVARKLASLAMPVDQRADLMQALRERMLVARAGQREIATYDGRAPLALWLRVAAVQMARRQIVRDRRAVALDDHQLAQVAPGVPDPALLYLKRHYGAQFRRAFAAAVDSLEPRQRNLLRHAVLDELGIDQIAAIYHVHRATAARQLKQARGVLVAATRVRLRDALGVTESELESILRGIMSLADVTLRTLLAKGRGHIPEGL
jgi:RNA polymerase sigma-70 factor, ECF subfamily